MQAFPWLAPGATFRRPYRGSRNHSGTKLLTARNSSTGPVVHSPRAFTLSLPLTDDACGAVHVRRTGVALPGAVLESCRAKTRDLGGSVSTMESAAAVIALLGTVKTLQAV